MRENPQKRIWNWYLENKKQFLFPWRRTRDPYCVLVSEVMLQQTQIARVIPKYEEWLRVFPDARALARAPFPKVLQMWQGLGYNRRARYLKEAAKKVVTGFGGNIPRDPHVLETFPGIGHYTARAVACFAYGQCEPFLDTNIRRVAIHFLLYRSKIGTKAIHEADVLEWLGRYEPKRGKRDWYYALMDYGREVLGGKKDNPNRRSVHYRTQSRFEGSRRYVRAKIVAYLLSRKSGAALDDIKNHLSRDPHSKLFLSGATLSGILRDLKKDNLAVRSNGYWRIAG